MTSVVPDRRALSVPPVAAALALVALTLAAYWPALGAGFVFDDVAWVTASPMWRELAGLRHIWLEPSSTPQYYPLTYASFWLEYRLWGVDAFGAHLVNILLHALNSVLLWRVLRACEVRGAWLAAAIFAVHPVHVESVAWVAERKNGLSALFSLGAILIFWQRILPRERVASAAAGTMTALFAAALLSKTVACTLPVVIGLLVYWRQGRVPRRIGWLLASLLAVGLSLAAVTVWVERYHAGSAGAEWALSLPERVLVAGRAFWFYPRLLLWPHPLAVIYPRWVVDVHAWWQYLFPAAAAAAIAMLFVARRWIGRGPVVAMLCFAVMLAPVSGLFDVAFMQYTFVADHFAYVPSIPLIVLAVAAGSAGLPSAATPLPRAAVTIVAVLLIGLASLTAARCTVYRTPRAFWTDALAKNPESWLVHNNLGGVLAADGDHDGAIAQYHEALRLRPDYIEAHYNLGNALQDKGQGEDAIPEYSEALRRKPDFAAARYRLADSLAAEGRVADAIAQYREALDEVHTDEWEAHNVIGNALRKFGHLDEAISEYEAAVRLQPAYAEAHNNLGSALVTHGQTEAGIAALETAVRLRPDSADAQYNLGTVLLGLQRLAAAEAHLRAAIAARPDYAEAHNNLGYLLFQQGQSADAIAEYQRALRIRPDYPDALANLSVARAGVGRTPGADHAGGPVEP